MTLGQKLKLLAKSKGLSQQDLADRVGVSKTTMNAWLQDHRYPALDEAIKLADVLNVHLDRLTQNWSISELIDSASQAKFEQGAAIQSIIRTLGPEEALERLLHGRATPPPQSPNREVVSAVHGEVTQSL